MADDLLASSLADKYIGIEGFYFLHAEGELGYITGKPPKFFKETFPQVNDSRFLAEHPHFVKELEEFNRNVKELSGRYLDSFESEMELGYVRPTAEDECTWHSATLVLHTEVIDALRRTQDYLLDKGIKDPFQVAGETEKDAALRSIQHGLDDVAHHTDTFGFFPYYPVLFHRRHSAGDSDSGLEPDVQTAPLRVLNLMWRPSALESGGAPAINDTGRCETVFSVLRDNLLQHGAVDRSRRVENRFSID